MTGLKYAKGPNLPTCPCTRYGVAKVVHHLIYMTWVTFREFGLLPCDIFHQADPAFGWIDFEYRVTKARANVIVFSLQAH